MVTHFSSLNYNCRVVEVWRGGSGEIDAIYYIIWLGSIFLILLSSYQCLVQLFFVLYLVCNIYIQASYNIINIFAGRAGYTLDELFTSIRSHVLEQRRIGLSVLANILARAKEGFYDKCVNPPVVQLVVSGQSWSDTPVLQNT